MSCLLQIEIISGNHIPKLSLERVQNVFVAKNSFKLKVGTHPTKLSLYLSTLPY